MVKIELKPRNLVFNLNHLMRLFNLRQFVHVDVFKVTVKMYNTDTHTVESESLV